MPASKAHIRATTKYENKSYDKITLRVRKDSELTREKINSAAIKAGESMNAFIMQAIKERIEKIDQK